MPELPEVETIRRQLEPTLLGRRIVGAWGDPSPKFREAPEAVERRISGLRRRGKYLLVDLEAERGEPEGELILHLGMTGVLGVHDDPGPPTHLRAWWALDDGRTFRFNDVRRFGRLAVVEKGDHRRLPTLHALGPEPLDGGFTVEGLWRSLRASRLRVKTQLLQQRTVAGVGNIYADEALWAAGVDPGARTVTRAQAERLWVELRRVLQDGVDHGGTTLRDYRDARGGTGDHQHHLRCYGRAGEPCERCGSVLARRIIDQRGTTWCPGCQGRRTAR